MLGASLIGLLLYNLHFTPDPKEPLFSTGSEPVSSLRIDIGSERYTIARQGNEWVLSYPIQTTVNTQIIHDTLSALQTSTKSGIGIQSPSMYPLYGIFTPESKTITIETSTGRSHTLTLGKGKNNSIYALFPDSPELYKTTVPLQIFSNVSLERLQSGTVLEPRQRIENMEVLQKDMTKSTFSLESNPLQIALLQHLLYSKKAPMTTSLVEELERDFLYKFYFTFSSESTLTLYIHDENNELTGFIPGKNSIYTFRAEYRPIFDLLFK